MSRRKRSVRKPKLTKCEHCKHDVRAHLYVKHRRSDECLRMAFDTKIKSLNADGVWSEIPESHFYILCKAGYTDGQILKMDYPSSKRKRELRHFAVGHAVVAIKFIAQLGYFAYFQGASD